MSLVLRRTGIKQIRIFRQITRLILKKIILVISLITVVVFSLSSLKSTPASAALGGSQFEFDRATFFRN